MSGVGQGKVRAPATVALGPRAMSVVIVTPMLRGVVGRSDTRRAATPFVGGHIVAVPLPARFTVPS